MPREMLDLSVAPNEEMFTMIRAEDDELRAIDVSKCIQLILFGKFEPVYERSTCASRRSL